MIDILSTINTIGDFIRTYGSAIIATAAIVTVFLTDSLNKRREKKLKKEQSLSVRILINSEIEQNLAVLKDLMKKLNEKANERFKLIFSRC